MADSKLADLTAETSFGGTELLYLDDGGLDRKGTIDNVVAGSAHAGATTSVHGITDTANLLDTGDIGSTVQAHSTVLDNTTASYTTAEATKVGYLTVTQAVDLDSIESRVNELDAAVILQGSWDASSGSFPGGGTAQAGHSYIVSVSGTVDSVAFVANDRIVAITDNASTSTYASNWLKLDYSDEVLSVAGLTGTITDTGLRSAINVEDGATADQTKGDIDALNIDADLVDGSHASDLLARANHTGTQASSTISDFAEAVSDQVGSMVTGNTETGIAVSYVDGDNTLDFAVQYGTPSGSLTPDEANAAGSADTAARSDHQHNIPAATATGISDASTNTEGSASSFARSDHTHAVTGFETAGAVSTHEGAGDPHSQYETSAEAAAKVSAHASATDHPNLDSAGTPADLGSPARGVGTEAARDDHVHQMPDAADVGASPTGHGHAYGDLTIDYGEVGDIVALNPDETASAGALNEVARADHAHSVPAAAATGISDASTNTEGVSTSFARADHTHAITGFALTSHTHTSSNISDFTEAVQDAMGGAFTDSATVDFTYDDVANTLTAAVLDSPTVAGATPAQLRDRSTHTGTQTLSTISDSGALAALSTVGTSQIDNNAVSLAKMADIATASFLGRTTAATGDPEVLTAAQARTLLNVEDGATADQTKGDIDALGINADQVDGSDASDLLARGNHTGTQTASTISDFAEATSDQVGTMVTGNTETGISVSYDDADNTLDFAVAYGTPSGSLTPDEANSAGAANTAARSDHQHNIPAAAPTTALSSTSSNAEGSGSSFARNDHAHAVTFFDATTPAALTPDIAGAVGAATTAARRDHVHNVPAATAVGLSNSSTSAEGNSTSFARANHTHAITGFAVPTDQLHTRPELKDWEETYTNHPTPGATETIDVADGNVHALPLSANCTLTFTAPTGTAVAFTLIVIQDTTARTITWPGSVDWAGGTAPDISTGSGAVDIFVFITRDGGTIWHGMLSSQGSS